MLRVIFTLDYEIHGNGEGSPRHLMVQPTWDILNQFSKYGAKLTILADIAEILKFREYHEQYKQDDYDYAAIVRQLQSAVVTGHDVQLHLHSSYMKAQYTNGYWKQNYDEYEFASLPYPRLHELIKTGKAFLEDLLIPVKADYTCYVFRAPNWSMQPSKNVVRALVENGFNIDTSVFKHGRRNGIVNFNYSHAPSNLVPWRASEEDICRRDPDGSLCEAPIYTERRSILAFLRWNRCYRALQTRFHPHNPDTKQRSGESGSRTELSKVRHLLFSKHAWKADFNQCSGSQLINALKRAERKHQHYNIDLPFVLIGHSKIFNRFNERNLEPFLRFVASSPDRFAFGTFADIDFANFD